ncbi:A24 family peptidase [Streptomyces sp. TRM70350]|uniref:prepilin peptidase n=1 Tax=Streptomyces sp. TRM70350 TaxID=2856165 RepID=UPI001C46D426|nr:A24 family peptidase [Streptomyces sp. TRM70350]MBV7696918.1 A24 family peptidase [Streptomyces sp. TRM70350]
MGEGLLVAAALVWGAVAGALLPRAAYRFCVPPEEAWRDRCPGGHAMRGWIGWGRCAECARSYGPGVPLVATVTAVLCAVLAVVTGPHPELGVWLLITPVGVLLAVVDLRVRRLPDPLTLPLAAATPALLGVAALAPGPAGDWGTALLGAVALGGFYFLLFLINPGGLGFGDVKLAVGAGAVLGWYGWWAVLLGTFAAFLCGAVYGGVRAVVRKTGRKTVIPFGPFLLAGAYAGLLLGAVG